MPEAPAPRFAVIIPVYNGAATLAQALDSVLAQTWPAHEIIVVDDGSRDASAEVAAAYGGRVSLIRQPNGGVSAARNAGARAATAEWLCFLDADDWYYPERLAVHAAMIRQDPALDFLTGDFDYVDSAGRHLRRSMECTAAGRLLLREARDGHAVMGGVPRATFLELGGYPTGFAVCEDVNFLIRLCARSRRAGVVCTPMAAYRIHDGSATRSDPLRAQQQTLAALLSLVPQLRTATPCIRRDAKPWRPPCPCSDTAAWRPSGTRSGY